MLYYSSVAAHTDAEVVTINLHGPLIQEKNTQKTWKTKSLEICRTQELNEMASRSLEEILSMRITEKTFYI